MIAPGNDRKRPLRRRLAEQRLCRVLDGVVAPRADGDRGLRSACCGRHQHVAHAVLVDEEHAVFRARAAIVVELSSWLNTYEPGGSSFPTGSSSTVRTQVPWILIPW